MLFNFKKILFLFILIFILSACSSSQDNIVIIHDKKIKVRVADDSKEQWQGLSGVEKMREDEGMLFIFPDFKKRTFVMRNMLIPLDIIFLQDNKVIDIYKNLPPEGADYKKRYSSSFPVNFVLELNAGSSDRLKIKKGDEFIYNLLQN